MTDTPSPDTPSTPASSAQLTEAEVRAYAQRHAEAIARQYMREAGKLWKRVDVFSTWLTAAGGASIAIAVSQLPVIRERLHGGGSRALLWTLALSVLLGLIEKYLAFSVGLGAALTDANAKVVENFLRDNGKIMTQVGTLGGKAAVEKYLLPLFLSYVREMQPAIPRPFRFLVRAAVQGSFSKSKQDDQLQLRWLIWQVIAVHVQVAALIVAVVIAAFAA